MNSSNIIMDLIKNNDTLLWSLGCNWMSVFMSLNDNLTQKICRQALICWFCSPPPPPLSSFPSPKVMTRWRGMEGSIWGPRTSGSWETTPCQDSIWMGWTTSASAWRGGALTGTDHYVTCFTLTGSELVIGDILTPDPANVRTPFKSCCLFLLFI